MGKKSSSQLKLSPNELEKALREEKQKRKIFRLQQVREQAREEAQRVRSAVRTRESEVVQSLKEDLRLEWQSERNKEVQERLQEHQDCLQTIGQAHRLAQQQPDAVRVLKEQGEHNRAAAEQRGKEARKAEKERENQHRHQQEWPGKYRQDALVMERERAERVARLPTPQALRKKTVVEEERGPPRVQLHEAGTFTTTSYIPKHVRIEKEVWSTKPDAKTAAAREEREQAGREAAKKRAAEAEARKREERGREALAKERVTRMAQQLVAGLDQAQHKHQLSVFLNPLHSSVSEAEERQLEREVERILQATQPPSPATLHHHPSPHSSPSLETIDTSQLDMSAQTPSTKVRGLSSLLEQMQKRRNQLLQGIYSSVSEKGTSEGEHIERERQGPEAEPTPQDSQGIAEQENPYLAETVPADLHQQESSRWQDVSGRLGSGLEEKAEGVTTSTDDATLPTSLLTPFIPEGGSSSEVESTDYMSPPSSLPSRREPPRDVRKGVGDREHQERPLSDDDIHFAETVPVDCLPLYRPIRSSTIHQPTPLTHTSEETFQESSSDDIHFKIEVSAGSGSTLKTVTPGEESFPRPGSPLPLSDSGLTSTDYLRPPSSLLGHQFSYQDILEKMQKIQERRKNNQHHINSLSNTCQQQVSYSSKTSDTYIQKLKGEGKGQRPIKRRVKYEMQKRILLQHYLTKLLQMHGYSLENISASTVEESGLTISSLSSLLESWQWDGEDSSDTPPPPASETLTGSRSDSRYADTDQVPVRLSSVSTPSSESGSVKMSSANSRKPTRISGGQNSSEPYTEHLSFSHHDFGPGSTPGPLSAHSKQTLESASSESSLQLSSHSSGRYNRSRVTEKLLHDIPSTLQRLQQELVEKEKEVLERSSSLLEPYVPHISPESHQNILSTTPDHSLTTVSQSQEKKRLSTIHEASSDFTDSRLNQSESADYFTPSREYESSLGTTSEVSVAHNQIVLPSLISGTKLQTDTSSDEQKKMSKSDRKNLHQYQHFTLDYKYNHLEYTELREKKGERNYPRVGSSKTRNNSLETLPEATTGTLGTLEQIDRGKSYSLSSFSEDNTLHKQFKSDNISPSHGFDTEKSGESTTQNKLADQTRDTSRYSVIPGEKNLALSLEQSQQQHSTHSSSSPSPHHRSCTSSPLLSATPTPTAPEPDLGRAEGTNGSSESITSIPDMGEILQRFGLSWAGSMIRKMDQAEYRTSSGTDSSHQT